MQHETPPADWRDDMAPKYARLFGGRPAFASVGEGWKDVVLSMLAEIDAAVPADDGSFRITDIKTKFARLAVHHTGDDDIEAIVDRANERAQRTCETCGAPGVLRRRGWLVIACGEHAILGGGSA